MSADMGREKKMKNNFKRKEKRNSSRLYVGRACHDSLRAPAAVILTMRSLLAFYQQIAGYETVQQAARPSCVSH